MASLPLALTVTAATVAVIDLTLPSPDGPAAGRWRRRTRSRPLRHRRSEQAARRRGSAPMGRESPGGRAGRVRSGRRTAAGPAAALRSRERPMPPRRVSRPPSVSLCPARRRAGRSNSSAGRRRFAQRTGAARRRDRAPVRRARRGRAEAQPLRIPEPSLGDQLARYSDTAIVAARTQSRSAAVRNGFQVSSSRITRGASLSFQASCSMVRRTPTRGRAARLASRNPLESRNSAGR